MFHDSENNAKVEISTPPTPKPRRCPGANFQTSWLSPQVLNDMKKINIEESSRRKKALVAEAVMRQQQQQKTTPSYGGSSSKNSNGNRWYSYTQSHGSYYSSYRKPMPMNSIKEQSNSQAKQSGCSYKKEKQRYDKYYNSRASKGSNKSSSNGESKPGSSARYYGDFDSNKGKKWKNTEKISKGESRESSSFSSPKYRNFDNKGKKGKNIEKRKMTIVPVLSDTSTKKSLDKTVCNKCRDCVKLKSLLKQSERTIEYLEDLRKSTLKKNETRPALESFIAQLKQILSTTQQQSVSKTIGNSPEDNGTKLSTPNDDSAINLKSLLESKKSWKELNKNYPTEEELRTALAARQSLLEDLYDKIKKANKILLRRFYNLSPEIIDTCALEDDIFPVLRSNQKFIRWLLCYMDQCFSDIGQFENLKIFHISPSCEEVKGRITKYYYKMTMEVEGCEHPGIFIPVPPLEKVKESSEMTEGKTSESVGIQTEAIDETKKVKPKEVIENDKGLLNAFKLVSNLTDKKSFLIPDELEITQKSIYAEVIESPLGDSIIRFGEEEPEMSSLSTICEERSNASEASTNEQNQPKVQQPIGTIESRQFDSKSSGRISLSKSPRSCAANFSVQILQVCQEVQDLKNIEQKENLRETQTDRIEILESKHEEVKAEYQQFIQDLANAFENQGKILTLDSPRGLPTIASNNQTISDIPDSPPEVSFLDGMVNALTHMFSTDNVNNNGKNNQQCDIPKKEFNIIETNTKSSRNLWKKIPTEESFTWSATDDSLQDMELVRIIESNVQMGHIQCIENLPIPIASPRKAKEECILQKDSTSSQFSQKSKIPRRNVSHSPRPKSRGSSQSRNQSVGSSTFSTPVPSPRKRNLSLPPSSNSSKPPTPITSPRHHSARPSKGIGNAQPQESVREGGYNRFGWKISGNKSTAITTPESMKTISEVDTNHNSQQCLLK